LTSDKNDAGGTGDNDAASPPEGDAQDGGLDASEPDGSMPDGAVPDTGPATFKVSATIVGFEGEGLHLTLNGADDLWIDANGTYEFATRLESLALYSVTIEAQAYGTPCTLTGGDGSVASSDVNVQVTCMWPQPVPNSPSLTALPNPAHYTYEAEGDTVTDDVTGLVWERDPDTSPRDHDAAKAYCDQLKLAGATDWRLPSARELFSLIDFSLPAPTIDAEAFPSAVSAGYWSSTDFGTDGTRAWVVRFSNSDTGEGLKSSAQQVRCVRSPGSSRPDVSASRFMIKPTSEGDAGLGEEVLDRATGLVWERAFTTGGGSIADCAAHCASLGEGWRMPTIKELFSVLDLTRSTPPIDPTVFTATSIGGGLRSASVHSTNGSYSWVVFGGDGHPFPFPDSPYGVACVK